MSKIIVIEPTNAEWGRMWNALARDPLNIGLSDPKEAMHEGECWQYMETVTRRNGTWHIFRHRCHPKSDEREYIEIPMSVNRIRVDRDKKGRTYWTEEGE